MTKHGAPDFYQYRRDSPTHPIADPAELAARLASQASFDRRGEVSLLANFEDLTDGWLHDKVEGTETVSRITTAALTNHYAAEITTAAGFGSGLDLQRGIPVRAATRFGLTTCFSYGSDNSAIRIWLGATRGNQAYRGGLRHYHDGGTLQYYDHNEDWQDLDTITTQKGTWRWNAIKLVIDWANGTYLRAIFNDQTYDLSSIPLYDPALTVTGLIQIFLKGFTSAASASTIRFANVTVTQHEPS